jgi:hypothetical protein
MTEVKEPAKKSNKLTQLEERYKKLYKDKKILDEYIKSRLSTQEYESYTQIEIGTLDLAHLHSLFKTKEFTHQLVDCDIITYSAYTDMQNQIATLKATEQDLANKVKLLFQDISSKTEELSNLRKREEQKITGEAETILNKLKFGNSETDALQNKYNDLLSTYNTLKIEMQKKMQEARIYTQLRDPLVSESTTTDTEENKNEELKKEIEITNDRLTQLQKEYISSKDKAMQMLMEKDKEISSLKSSISESQNMSRRSEVSIGNANLNRSSIRPMEYDEEVASLKELVGLHAKNEKLLADKIKSMEPSVINLEYIKNIFLKYQLYSKFNEKTEMMMMQSILYDIFKVSSTEKEDLNKGRHGFLWKAMQNAQPDVLYNMFSGKASQQNNKIKKSAMSDINGQILSEYDRKNNI